MVFPKVRGEHHETKKVVESKTMVYGIEGDIVLVSKAVWAAFQKPSPKLENSGMLEIKLSQEKLLLSTQFLQAGGLMGQGILTYLRRMLRPMMTSQDMSTTTPLLPMLVRTVRLAWWVG